MNNTLYNFINAHQFQLTNIFYSNRHTKGEGALYVDVNPAENKVDVKFLEKKDIPQDVEDLFNKYTTSEKEDKAVKKDENKDYLVIDMSPIPDKLQLHIPDYLLYFIIKDNNYKEEGKEGDRHFLLVGAVESFNYCGKRKNKFVFRCEVDKKKKDNNKDNNQDNNKENNEDNSNTKNKQETYYGIDGWTIAETHTGTTFLNYCKSLFDDTDEGKEKIKNFRKAPEFAEIITTYSRRYGEVCIMQGLINTAFGHNLDNIPEEIGNPLATYQFKIGNGDKLREFSVDTLRYMKTTSHILSLLGDITKEAELRVKQDSKSNMYDLSNFNIIEIASGYGGLCNMFSRIIDYKSYTLIELPELAKLSTYFLNENKLLSEDNKNSILINPETTNQDTYDLCISEFGICEFDEKCQSFYMNRIVKRSHRAYFVMNIWDDVLKRKFKDKLSMIFKNVEELPEQPKTKWNNYIYYCYNNVFIN